MVPLTCGTEFIQNALKHEQKCLPPPTLPYKWPLGLDLVLEAFNADRSGEILTFFVSLVERTGINFEQIIFNARGIDTVDPRNIEAVLSTQFQGMVPIVASHGFAKQFTGQNSSLVLEKPTSVLS